MGSDRRVPAELGQESKASSCLTPCDPVDCSPPGCSVHGILQARILECPEDARLVPDPIALVPAAPDDGEAVSEPGPRGPYSPPLLFP